MISETLLRDSLPIPSSTFLIHDEVDEDFEVPTMASNVRKDLIEWQERHATLVLTTVKKISRLIYELCPRVMKERRFWRIYFTRIVTSSNWDKHFLLLLLKKKKDPPTRTQPHRKNKDTY